MGAYAGSSTRTLALGSPIGTIDVELAQRLARLAVVAADLVQPGMLVGLGTGASADAVSRELGRRVADGLRFTGVATSCRTDALARALAIPLTSLDEVDRLDLGIDGADEIDPALNAIKGRGGALVREKLVALSCRDYVFVATTEKNVTRLGERTPLPVEIVPFGWRQTAKRLADLHLTPQRRPAASDSDRPWITDNGGYILDCATGELADPAAIAAAVKATPGVVEHGLFLGIATLAVQVNAAGEVLRRERAHA
jgi:ribose 5-phosphate isomerase A